MGDYCQNRKRIPIQHPFFLDTVLNRPSQRRSPNHAPVVSIPSIVYDVLNSPGQPLDPATRAFMEPRFAHDFSHVRVHTDATAAESARTLHAAAFTVHPNIVFGGGRYVPESLAGRALLAHELAHIAQETPGIACADESWTEKPRVQSPQTLEPIPGPDIVIPGAKKARSYEPKFRPRPERETIPYIEPPPLPEKTKTPSRCPSLAEAKTKLQNADIINKTENRMQHTINLAQARKTFKLTRVLINQADQAIRKTFGNLIPAGRSLTNAISIESPNEFATKYLTQGESGEKAGAYKVIGDVSLAAAPDELHELCITAPKDKLLVSEVASPLLTRRGLDFVRSYVGATIGGYVMSSAQQGKWSRHAHLPTEGRHIGHSLVHEGIHFYAHEKFVTTADGHPLEKELIEGGTEYLTRKVINQHLEGQPVFQVGSAYDPEFQYVRTYLAIRSFEMAYFKGYVDLLALSPKTVQTQRVGSSGR